ncbi:CLN3 protein [Cordyceps javanica]|nr:CLN3 protein [Cordyceps javanica]
MTDSSASSYMRLPLPGTPSSSWDAYSARLNAICNHPNMKVVVAFWLLGALPHQQCPLRHHPLGRPGPRGHRAQGRRAARRRGAVLLRQADRAVLYPPRALPHPSPDILRPVRRGHVPRGADAARGLRRRQDGRRRARQPEQRRRLAGWGSGTGAAGLVGAGLYVAMTEWWRFSVRGSLLFAATLPVVMLASFFAVLPQGPLLKGATGNAGYGAVPGDDAADDEEESSATAALLNPRHAQLTANRASELSALKANLRRARSLVIPYMLPLLLVYVAEYTINQGVAPTLLFPLSESPFAEFREFYPFYGFLYQLGVFISRSSISFVRIHRLYLPSFLQIGNLALLTLHAMLFFIPSVYFVFIIIFWEGLLGGAVYVNCFAEIMENVPEEEREFSLSATTVSDSGGICIAGLVGIVMETGLCNYQVAHGRDWCKQIKVQHG